ncbi:MAG TPA: hypothetical protein VK117_04330, partial [Pyrinomonadaceae bacterium]|nr:hypothetical protein [Pyrinomonadaceae bacterium]
MPLSHRQLNYRSLTAVLLLFFALLIVRLTPDANAQTASPTPAPGPSPQVAEVGRPTPLPAPPPKVVAIDGHLELDTIVGVEVEHFSEWAATHDATKLVPFINGRAVRGNYPEEIHPDRNRLHFHLGIKPQNKELWNDLLGAPHGLRHDVTFTIGLENESPFDSVFNQSQPLPLTVISPVYGVICLLVILFTLALFVWLTRTTNLIR